jgi:CrcB protein
VSLITLCQLGRCAGATCRGSEGPVSYQRARADLRHALPSAAKHGRDASRARATRRLASRENRLNPSTLHAYLLVAFGSGVGGAARLFVSTVVSRGTGTQFPWGTLVVNVAGCVLVGALGALFEPSSPLHVRQDLRVLLVVGVLGGFTTFSAFSLEALLLLQRGATLAAVGYVLGSVVACLLAASTSYVLISSVLR